MKARLIGEVSPAETIALVRARRNAGRPKSRALHLISKTVQWDEQFVPYFPQRALLTDGDEGEIVWVEDGA